MRHQLFTAAALLLACSASLAQVSTMGTTAMGLSSTPGAIVSSPLNGPSPFSAVTQPGTPDTTLAPVPLASDPTTPGTVVTCSVKTAQIAQGNPAVSQIGSPTGPASAVLGTISAGTVRSTTGIISPVSPLGTSSTPACSSTPGGLSTNGAALPLATPGIPSSPPPGTIQAVVAQLGDTSVDPTIAVAPTPNSTACSQGVTMRLANPGMMAPANATGATATPDVAGPLGC
jgi:hypothetical protein